MMMRSFAVPLAFALSAIAIGPAHAESRPIIQKKLVRYGDLNLASAEGQERLSFRIRHAARAVCGISGSRELRSMTLADDCYDNAIRLARQELASRGIGVSMASR
jgi:UrcA family protein